MDPIPHNSGWQDNSPRSAPLPRPPLQIQYVYEAPAQPRPTHQDDPLGFAKTLMIVSAAIVCAALSVILLKSG